ncbi:hypothetical protein ABMA28_002607 [Loxostege sticticalis]|uniref:Gustatory receptor n=1 Tax=Loxostege sticticalis TaxID=481309 RepID=A0ABD0T052_LOXSC
MASLQPQRQTSVEESEDNDNAYSKKTVELLNTNRPALAIECLFGIFRFRVQNNEVVPITKTMKLLCVLLLSFSLVVTVYCAYIRLSSAVGDTTKFVDIADEIPATVTLIRYILSAIQTTFFFNQENIRILTTLAELDVKLHVNTNKDFYKKSHRVTVTTVILLFIIHVVVGFIDIISNDDIYSNKFSVIPIYFVYMEQSLEVSVFCLMIMMLTRRLNIINNYLLKFIDEKDDNKAGVFIIRGKKEGLEEFNFIGRASSDNTKIRDLASTYDIIGESCALLNEMFNFQIFMTLVSTFIYVVITIWTSLYYYKSGEDPGSLVNTIMWSILVICLIASISLTCEMLLRSRTETKVLVNKIIMDYDLPQTMRVQAKAFMELIEAWPLRIFIYDMFSVDITLMLKYISVSTTYLIVIIQISHFI